MNKPRPETCCWCRNVDYKVYNIFCFVQYFYNGKSSKVDIVILVYKWATKAHCTGINISAKQFLASINYVFRRKVFFIWLYLYSYTSKSVLMHTRSMFSLNILSHRKTGGGWQRRRNYDEFLNKFSRWWGHLFPGHMPLVPFLFPQHIYPAQLQWTMLTACSSLRALNIQST